MTEDKDNSIAERPQISNTNRAEIYQMIKDNPGIRPCDINRKMNIYKNAVDFHIEKLIEDKLIIDRKVGKYRELFSYDTDPSDYLSFACSTQKRIFNIISSKEKMNLKDISNTLNCSKQLVSYHVNKLRKQDLIYYWKEQNRKIVSRKPKGRF